MNSCRSRDGAATIRDVEPTDLPPLPLGRARRLEAAPLANSDGDHAVLVRQGDEPRALLTTEQDDRLVLIPLDDRSEMRVDGDALAIWLTQGSLRPDRAPLAGWATAVGMALLLVVIGFAILGSLTFFGWLFANLGII
jgi:hypothetical protein